MNEESEVRKVVAQIKELTKSVPDNIAAFVIVVNVETGETSTCGLGCPACLIERIIEINDSEQFQHISSNLPEVKH